MSYRQNIYKYEDIYTISMDNIFLNQFNSTNNFFDGTISDIKNYVDTSDMNTLISCCEVMVQSEDTFNKSVEILNDMVEKMEILQSKYYIDDIRAYIFDTKQMFKLLVNYSKLIVNDGEKEDIETIYGNLMWKYDKYSTYKNKFI